MNTNQLMDEILAVLKNIQDDKNKLETLHEFVMDEIYEEPEQEEIYEELEPEQEEIPEKYKKVVYEIADYLLCGLICFFNPDTLEIEHLPEDLIDDPEEFEMMTGETWESCVKHESWPKCIEIKPMDSHDSFKVMSYFVDQVKDKYLREKLVNALNRRKPFANFKNQVEDSDYRQEWFDFRLKQWSYYVWDIIEVRI